MADIGAGCYSFVGRTGGRQNISLENGCIRRGTATHEILHALGFFHEQSRPDRDLFVEIKEENLMHYNPKRASNRQSAQFEGIKNQFSKYAVNEVAEKTMQIGYDYSSILHYGAFAYSRNGMKTIVGKKSGSGKMGQRDSLSDKDVLKLKKLYNCPDSPPVVAPVVFQTTTAKSKPAPCEDSRYFRWFCPVLYTLAALLARECES